MVVSGESIGSMLENAKNEDRNNLIKEWNLEESNSWDCWPLEGMEAKAKEDGDNKEEVIGCAEMRKEDMQFWEDSKVPLDG